MSKNLLFVVHRYYPYPGGSETNVRRLAEECVRRGHNVWVLSDTHQGNQNGVKVTSDRAVVFQQWDMIFVHGSCPTQDFVHANSEYTGSKIYYLIVQPTDSEISQHGMKHAKWIGCGTSFDLEHVSKYGHTEKARHFQYGITDQCFGTEGYRASMMDHIKTPFSFLSVGGFWPHKKMDELVSAFNEAGRTDVTLVLFGYDTQYGKVPESTEFVKAFECQYDHYVYSAMLESDLLIMNSESEGYGLVLLEAMYNRCEWISRNIAAAHDLNRTFGFGTVYDSYEELVKLLKEWTPDKRDDKAPPAKWVENNAMISHSVDLLLSVLD